MVRRVVWIVVGVVVLGLVAVGAWLAVKAVAVKDALEAAQAELSVLQDGGPIEATLKSVGDHASKAVEETDDAVWRLAESLPMAGDNLRGVRLSAELLDEMVHGLALPVLQGEGATAGLGARLADAVTTATPRIEQLADEIGAVAASDFLIEPVREGVAQVEEAVEPVRTVLDVAPYVLGIDEPRHFLLAFQNNAETLPLGGSAAAQMLVRVADGELSIVDQAHSKDFRNGEAVDVDVDQSAIDLYTEYLRSHVNTTVSRPDFPTAARLLTAFWDRDITDVPIDGVISVDPLALTGVLRATGNVTVKDIEITPENGVDMLLSEAYRLFDSKLAPGQADEFFALTASAVFDRIAGGEFEPAEMVRALTESIDNGDIMVFAEDERLAELIAGQRVAGVLPTSNAESTTVGVYLRDTSSSKIDYYMRSAAAVSATCEAGMTRFEASAELHMDLTPELAATLPAYVVSSHWGAEKFRTEVFVYGPPGTTFASATVDGASVTPVRTDIVDLGRPVAKFETFLKPGERASVEAVFTGDGTFGPLDVWVTPMINPTEVAVSGVPCG